MTDAESKATPELSSGMRMALDFGPVLVFFAANYLVSGPLGVFYATGAFMVAMGISMAISMIKTGKISPMLMFSGVMVLVFGGITLWLRDETFIKVKPTIYYVFIASILIGGLLTKRPTLQALLDSAIPGLSDRGWNLFTRNYAIFFLFMAVVNEAVWRNFSTDFWIGFKLWGAIPLTLIFGMANVPMLLKHGFAADEAEAPPTIEPSE